MRAYHRLTEGERNQVYALKKGNSQAPQPPTVFFVSFDVSLLCHRVHKFSVVV